MNSILQTTNINRRIVLLFSFCFLFICFLVMIWIHLPTICNQLPGNVLVYKWMTDPRTKKQQVEKDMSSLMTSYIALRLCGIDPVDNNEWLQLAKRASTVDPWGGVYMYISKGPQFISSGPDGKFETSDDIKSTILSEEVLKCMQLPNDLRKKTK
jgi:hypothetical protein